MSQQSLPAHLDAAVAEGGIARFIIAFLGILGIYAGLAKLGAPDLTLQGVVAAVGLIAFAGYAVFVNTVRGPGLARG